MTTQDNSDTIDFTTVYVSNPGVETHDECKAPEGPPYREPSHTGTHECCIAATELTHEFFIWREGDDPRKGTGYINVPVFFAVRDYTEAFFMERDVTYNRARCVMEEAHADNPDVYTPGTYWVALAPRGSGDDYNRRSMSMHRIKIVQTTHVSDW